jgi:threonine dehydrogenase-like Zn-dependent dehydrogenase
MLRLFAAAREAAGTGRDVVAAPVEATGLEEDSATVVVADGLLSTLSDDGRAGVLSEAARLLRAGGRIAIHGAFGTDLSKNIAPVRIRPAEHR